MSNGSLPIPPNEGFCLGLKQSLAGILRLPGAPACFMLVKDMDRDMLLAHLKQAERHVAEGVRVLEHQRCLIEHLRRDAHSERVIGEAERLLHSFEEAQSLHVADAARLRGQLQTPR